MDAVLPLAAADLDRASRILLPSLQKHCHDLRTLHVVGPARDLAAIAARLRDPRISLIVEDDLVPEFAAATRLGLPPVSGWYKQQLIKLAVAARVATDFYLTLDADLIAVETFGDDDCIRDGRALRDKEPINSNAVWLEWAARVIGGAPLDYQPAVTPAILSRDAVLGLARHVAARPSPPSHRWRVGALLGRVYRPWSIDSWRGRLIASLPWTEYALYDTYLAHAALFDRFHRAPTDTLLQGNSVWHTVDFSAWQPRNRDAAGRRLLFNVVQSRNDVPLDAVLAKLAAPLPSAS